MRGHRDEAYQNYITLLMACQHLKAASPRRQKQKSDSSPCFRRADYISNMLSLWRQRRRIEKAPGDSRTADNAPQ